VGFVSGDFRKHPITYFTTGLFEHLPRNEIEVFAYHNHISHDEMTSKIKGLVDHWRVIADQDSKSVCELIRTDGIDVLIDLSGHTGYHRLDVFAKKPAPVSASWLGFVSTTGIRNIDYFIATECLIPHEEAKYYSEEIAYLPKDISWASFNICSEVMSPELPPCIKNDYITFGSFNNLIKVNENVLNSWAKILLAVPNSKLFLNYKQLLDNHVRIKTINDFKRLGVDESRLRLECTSPRSNSLNAYSEIDIALDPFPYGGATTTCEALYMGVPVITLKGDRFSGRLTQDYLKQFSWSATVVGNTQDEYVEKAVALAKNKDFLISLRKHQRDAFESSIGNHQSFAQEFSKLIRSLFYKKIW
jgi:predicted O-linked N-acetylglucosamine transferase (SPINDLY family)